MGMNMVSKGVEMALSVIGEHFAELEVGSWGGARWALGSLRARARARAQRSWR
jgi:hypothetical protein